MKRGIKILIKCAWCKRAKYHTSYNEISNSFVCRMCFRLITANPEIVLRKKGEGRSGLIKVPYEQRDCVIKLKQQEAKKHETRSS